jgi:hypothetical protein
MTTRSGLPVRVENTPEVLGDVYDTGLLLIPNVDTSGAYTAGDAIGSQFDIELPFTKGYLYSATYYDRDDEGTQMNLIISESRWLTQIADDAAMEPADAELIQILELLKFTVFEDFVNGQISRLRNIGLAFDLPTSRLWLQMESPGATPTIAAGSEPMVRLQFVRV